MLDHEPSENRSMLGRFNTSPKRLPKGDSVRGRDHKYAKAIESHKTLKTQTKPLFYDATNNLRE